MTNDPFGVAALDRKESECFGWVERIDLPGQPVFQQNRIFFAQALLEIGQGGDPLDESLLDISVTEIFGSNGQEHLLLCLGRRRGLADRGFDTAEVLLESEANDLDLVHGRELKG